MKWMRKKVAQYSLIAVLAIVVFLPAVWLSAQTTQQSTTQGETFDLAKLSIWNDKTLPAEAKTIMLIDYLEGELQNPSKPKMGYGGIIDTAWIQRQIVIALGLAADTKVLADEIKRTKDSKLKDRLLIALCMASKGKNAVPEVIQILKTSPEGHVRALAARSLGEAKNSQYKAAAITALTAALRDTYKRPIREGEPGIYEVRQDAAGALASLGVKVKNIGTATEPIFQVVK